MIDHRNGFIVYCCRGNCNKNNKRCATWISQAKITYWSIVVCGTRAANKSTVTFGAKRKLVVLLAQPGDHFAQPFKMGRNETALTYVFSMPFYATYSIGGAKSGGPNIRTTAAECPFGQLDGLPIFQP